MRAEICTKETGEIDLTRGELVLHLQGSAPN